MKKLVSTIGLLSIFLLIGAVYAAVDTSKIGIKKGDVFTYKYIVDDSDSSAENSTFTVTITDIKDGKVSYTYKDSKGEENNETKLDEFGSAAIYTDWAYWDSKDNILSSSSGLSLMFSDVTIDNGDDVFIATFSNSTTNSELGIKSSNDMVISYDKGLGIVKRMSIQISFESSLFSQSSNITYELTSVDTGANEAKTPGFELAIVSLSISALVLIRKRR